MNAARPRPLSKDSSEADDAMNWLVLMRNSPDISSERRQAFEAWKSIPANALAYSRAQQIAEDFRHAIDVSEVMRKRKEIHGWVRARRRTKRRAYSLAMAACIALLVGTSAIYSRGTLPRFPWDEPVAAIYSTAVGERRTAHLEDGSAVTLDTNTLVKVAFGSERAIEIESGRVLFAVAKGDKRPFVVYAGQRRVIATGTVFDVRLDSGSVAVTLIEGTVTVDRYAPGRPKVRVGPTSVMHPGERLVGKIGGPAVLEHVNVETATAWSTGKHIFKDTPLRLALAEVNRYTDKPIVLSDADLAGMPINGVFPTGRPGAFARAIVEVNDGLALSYDANGALRLHKKKS